MATTHHRLPHLPDRSKGFSLVELMVAIGLGLVLTTIVLIVFVNSRGASRRLEQMSAIQQSVRTAFEYLTFDARMVGHMGCFTRNTGLKALSPIDVSNNFGVGIEGYEFADTAAGTYYSLSSYTPANITTANSWSNSPGATTTAVPLTALSGGSTVGLSPGSDVLILRMPTSGRPTRLAASATGAVTALSVESRSTGKCPNGNDNVGGFCIGSFGVIASCTAAEIFKVSATSGTTLTLTNALNGSGAYAIAGAEVLPLQTVAYYIKRSSSGTSTSLYRRVLDGAQTDVGLQEQELIENVEAMQIRYAVDTDPTPDGIINGDYLTANVITDWSQVIAVRVSLLVRSGDSIDASAAGTAIAPVVNGLEIRLPATGARFDQQVFTTTIALRNRIS